MDTPDSLFDRLKRAKPDDPDWKRLHDLYHPLIRKWFKKLSVHENDIDDLTQQVLTTIARSLPNFTPQRDGSFRAWLLQVCRHAVSACWRKQQRQPKDLSQSLFEQLVDPKSETTQGFNSIYDKELFGKLLELIRLDFEELTWVAFRRFAIEKIPSEQVANELGISKNAVIQAKRRVMKRLREEGGHFLL